MSEIKFYILDVETTGLKPGYHEMTELGIIRCEDKLTFFKKIKCVYPQRASIDALRITNKTQASLREGDSQFSVVLKSNEFFSSDNLTPAHRCIVGHNIRFDRGFLHQLWLENNQTFPADLWLDTMKLTKFYAKKIGLVKQKFNLHASCDIVGIKKLSDAHNAKVDCKNTYFLHQNLVEDKQIDYLPFIENIPHLLSSDEKEEDFESFE